jgi:hypothetical protein
MKKILFIITLLIFVGCSSFEEEPKEKKIYIIEYNGGIDTVVCDYFVSYKKEITFYNYGSDKVAYYHLLGNKFKINAIN